MTITALITGKLIADPERRTSSGGKAFATARLAACTDDESVLVSCVAFGSVADQLAALNKGDTVAITGRTKVKAWAGKEGEPRAGLDVVADSLLTVYHLRKKRAAMNPEPADPLGDPNPEWSTRAGFANRFEAENAGCGPGNAAQFKGGRRVGQ